jgi:hypothetical protein
MKFNPKTYSFFAHFNRISMQRGLRAVWTVHFRGACYPANEVLFKVPIHTRFRPEGRQPRAVLLGRAERLVYAGSTIILK